VKLFVHHKILFFNYYSNYWVDKKFFAFFFKIS
jgi:hypothetical protein